MCLTHRTHFQRDNPTTMRQWVLVFKLYLAVVVAQLVNQLPLTVEIRSSNPVIMIFYLQ